MLTQWLRRGSCGGPIAVTGGGHTGQIRHYYTCATRQDNKANCEGLTVGVEKLDTAVLDYIHDDALSPANVPEMVDYGIAALSEQPDEIVAQRARLSADIAELDARIRKVGLQVADDILTTEEAKALNAPLIDRREAMKVKIEVRRAAQLEPNTRSSAKLAPLRSTTSPSSVRIGSSEIRASAT